MRNGRTFPYRLRRARARAATRKGMLCGVLDVPVKARRPGARQVRLPSRPRRETKPTRAKQQIPCRLEKPRGRAPQAPVPKPTQVGG